MFFFPVVSLSVLKQFFTFLKWRQFPLQCENYPNNSTGKVSKETIQLLSIFFSVYLNTEIELNFTPNIRHFFSPVSTCYSGRVSYDANKQLKRVQKQTRKIFSLCRLIN